MGTYLELICVVQLLAGLQVVTWTSQWWWWLAFSVQRSAFSVRLQSALATSARCKLGGPDEFGSLAGRQMELDPPNEPFFRCFRDLVGRRPLAVSRPPPGWGRLVPLERYAPPIGLHWPEAVFAQASELIGTLVVLVVLVVVVVVLLVVVVVG